jgi:transcriptional regulator with XRE-family HTH domain
MGADFSKVLLEIAKPFSKPLSHACAMDITTREALAKNVRLLMNHYQMNQTQLGKRADVSQRSVSNVLNADCENSPTLQIIEKIAKAFHLETWHLLVPGLNLELLLNSRIESVVKNYATASHEGREMISRVSDREAAIAYSVVLADSKKAQ